jgi:hypothetical protein
MLASSLRLRVSSIKLSDLVAGGSEHGGAVVPWGGGLHAFNQNVIPIE